VSEEAFHYSQTGLIICEPGSINGVKLQVWATWLTPLLWLMSGDAIAELALRFDRISLEWCTEVYIAQRCHDQ